MSLDITLRDPNKTIHHKSSGIFIRENGATVEISIEEWNNRNPHKEPIRLEETEYMTDEVYSSNITHNLNSMANYVGIYEYLWRPDEIGITKAKDLVIPLTDGLSKLLKDPEGCKKYNPENGWGSYEVLVKFVYNYIEACNKYPNSIIEVCR
jgi:hypothetical protein